MMAAPSDEFAAVPGELRVLTVLAAASAKAPGSVEPAEASPPRAASLARNSDGASPVCLRNHRVNDAGVRKPIAIATSFSDCGAAGFWSMASSRADTRRAFHWRKLSQCAALIVRDRVAELTPQVEATTVRVDRALPCSVASARRRSVVRA